jgi:hypothetical protein
LEKDDGVVALSLTLFGAYVAALCALADKTHYMNRDDNTWSYASLNFAIFLIILAIFFTFNFM